MWRFFSTFVSMNRVETSEFERCLAITDDDLPVVATLYVWLSEVGELLVEYHREALHGRGGETTTRAVVDEEETETMARYFGLPKEALPALFEERCSLHYATTAGEVERLFQEALELILETGAQYRFRHLG